MTVMTGGDKENIFLPMRQSLTVVAAADSSARVTRLGDKAGEDAQASTDVASSETKIIGPYGTGARILIECLSGSAIWTQAVVDFDTAEEGLAAAVASRMRAIGATADTVEIFGDGVPVDYTDGDPAATGEGVAGIGSRYTDTTNGKLYLNAGTKAQPAWKIVTSAA